MGCIVDERDEAAAARRALLQHDAIWGASLTAPRESPRNAWEIEVTVVTEGRARPDGWAPLHQRTAADYGLTVVEVQPRSPTETRVLLTL